MCQPWRPGLTKQDPYAPATAKRTAKASTPTTINKPTPEQTQGPTFPHGRLHSLVAAVFPQLLAFLVKLQCGQHLYTKLVAQLLAILVICLQCKPPGG